MLHRIDGTWYGNEEGTKRYLRVTKALEVINKPGLMYWAADAERRAVIEAAADLHLILPKGSSRGTRAEYITRMKNHLGPRYRFLNESGGAKDIGSEVHNHIEAALRDELGVKQRVKVTPPFSCREAQGAFDEWQRWRAHHDLEPLFIEQTVWSDEHEYAGTADLIAKMDLKDGNGIQTVILDWKTSKGIYPEMHLQNAAYARAYCEMGHSSWPMTGLLVRLPKTGQRWEMVQVKAYRQEQNLKAFCHALNLAKHLLETSENTAA